MSKNWLIVCYAVAVVAFFLALIDAEIRPRRGRSYGWHAWIALGLLALAVVPLVSTINGP